MCEGGRPPPAGGPRGYFWQRPGLPMAEEESRFSCLGLLSYALLLSLGFYAGFHVHAAVTSPEETLGLKSLPGPLAASVPTLLPLLAPSVPSPTPLPESSTLAPALAPSLAPALAPSSPSPTPSPTPRARGQYRHALVLGGSIRSMRECTEAQLQRMGYGKRDNIDLLAHVGGTNPVFVSKNSDLASVWDAAQLQWLSRLALRMVSEDLDWEAGGANLTRIPQDARAAIPSWPFPVQGPDNPILNVLVNTYRRWRLLQMVEAEEAAGGFVYASITYMRPDLCPCAKDAYDLDTLFPPPGQAQPDRGQPLKVYSVAPAAAAPAPPAPMPSIPAASAPAPSAPAPSAPAPSAPSAPHVLYTPASYGRVYHVALLDRWVDDGDALGDREAMGWYLSVFPFSEVLSGHRGVRFHPETLNRQALLYGMELKAAQSSAVQEMHIFDLQQLRYCLMREPGTHQCDPGCTVRKPD